MSDSKILLYLMRRDLRVVDNPVLHEVSRLASEPEPPFTHLIPLYVFPCQQLEVSGFLTTPSDKSPYPEARSQVGGFWRCGPHRAKFLGETVWDLKTALENLGSGLEIRAGKLGEIVRSIVDGCKEGKVTAVWMTEEEGVEEKREERDVAKALEGSGAFLKLWTDEKYFIDDRDLPFDKPQDLPDVFTSYRKTVEPLRDGPRSALPLPKTLLPLPSSVEPQPAPFTIPTSENDLLSALAKPLKRDQGVEHPPAWPEGTKSAHPFRGGETAGRKRIEHLITSGSMSAYKDTRNGLLGLDFSTKLSAWLALGCITAREVHKYLLAFEDGSTDLGKGVDGYGKGENKGTAAVRFELLWRDYMRLCTRKFGYRLFRIEGFRNETTVRWKWPSKDAEARKILTRFIEGTTGIGLIDASMRELFLTGYTSNRARQNVASFLAKHMSVDWRTGAEWYESMLVDYDLSSNWGNWQYTSGVGNDPRGEARIFNPVKQAFDYDPKGDYVKAWIPELSGLEDPMQIFQAWKVPEADRIELGLAGREWVEKPLKKIDFHLNRGGRGKASNRGGGGGPDQGRGGGGYRGGGRANPRGGPRRGRGQGRRGMVDRAYVEGQ